MAYSELQKEVSKLVNANEISLASYLFVSRGMDELKDAAPPPYMRRMKAALLSSFTIQGLADVCRSRGIFHNLWMETYTAPYNQFTQEALADHSGLYQFGPDIIYLFIDTPDIIDNAHLQSVISSLLARTSSRIVISNFLESSLPEFCARNLNQELDRLTASSRKRIHIFNLEKFLEGEKRRAYWYTKYKDLGDFRIAPAAFVTLAESLLGYAIATAGATKKCAVLDLDNTLWRGIVGEDGLEGITPYQEIQQYLLSLFERGVVLAINSKNNPEDALTAIERHPDMLLRKKHFAAWRINWQSKEQNIAELAEELHLGMESFVFIDDDPFQRELMAAAFPEIAVIAPESLTRYQGFHSFALTDEDERRGAMYIEERNRQELKRSLRTEEDFLKELAIQIAVHDATEESIPRISQLTQKTNQFNLTTRRYSEDDIRRHIENGWYIWTVAVTDRFGDYGTVGVVMVEPATHEWRVDNFLLSCRILGRCVEDHLADYIKDAARKTGVLRIGAEYLASAKNQQTEKFWDRMAFKVVSESPEKKIYYYEGP